MQTRLRVYLAGYHHVVNYSTHLQGCNLWKNKYPIILGKKGKYYGSSKTRSTKDNSKSSW